MSCLCCWASDAESFALSSLVGVGVGDVQWGLWPRAEASSACWHEASNPPGKMVASQDCRPSVMVRPLGHVRLPSRRWGCPLRGLQSTPSPAQRLPGFPSSLFTPAPMPDSPNSKYTPLPSLFSSLKNRRVLLKVKVCTHVRARECTQTHMCTRPDAPHWAGGEGRTERSLHWTGWWRSDVSRKRQEANYQSLKRVGIYFSPLTRNLGGRV